MKLFVFGMFLFCSSVFASSKGYELKMELSLGGKPATSSQVMVKEGEVATITQKTETDETFIEVVAREHTSKDRKTILMNFTVGTIGKDGVRKIISTPRVITNENEAAQISVHDDANKSSELSLSVVVKRKTFKSL